MVGLPELLNLLAVHLILRDQLMEQLFLFTLAVPAAPVGPVEHSHSPEQLYPIMVAFDG